LRCEKGGASLRLAGRKVLSEIPKGFRTQKEENRNTTMRLVKIVAATAIALAAATGLASAKDWKQVRIGTEGAYPPFNSVDPSGELVGFDIEIAKALCEKMKVSCSYVAQDWDGIIPALLAGKYDAIVASMSITEERKKKVLFTNKYYDTPASFIGPKDSKLTDWSPEGLKGKVIGTQSSTTHANYLEEVYKPAGAEVKLYATQDEANADLAAGRLDAVEADKVVLSEWLKKPDGACCEFKLDVDKEKTRKIFGNGVGIAVRPDDTDLANLFNKAIAEIVADGTYKKINDKYFPFSIY
jgi:lysine-arginine-ornithine-binding protein